MKSSTPPSLRCRFGRRRTFLRGTLGLMGLAIVGGLAPKGAETPVPAGAPAVVRIGIAAGTWGGVNRNDATAAISAWARIIMKQRGMALEVETRLFESDEEMVRDLRSGRVDAVSMLTHQFLALEPQLQPDAVFLATRNHSITEQYVLLVHRSSGIGDLSGLRGGRLLLQSNARTSLAPCWLETLLARGSLGAAEGFFKSLTRIEKPSKMVMQVFFRQAEACLVTSNVFELAGELNPQIRQELRVLAVSPEVIPSLFYFRPGHTSRAREELEPAILALHERPAGQQVLTVFQGEQMVKRPIACFARTRELLAEYDRLKETPSNGERHAALAEKAAHAPP